MEYILFEIRYDTLKVKYDPKKSIVTLIKWNHTWAGVQDEIYLPRACIIPEKEYQVHNTGAARSLRWKEYLVDEIKGNTAYRYYYPTHYPSTGDFYKIEAETYYTDINIPNLNEKSTLNSDIAFGMYIDKYPHAITLHKASDNLLVSTKAMPKKVEGKDIKVKVVNIYHNLDRKVNSEPEIIPAKNWLNYYDDYDESTSCECLINEVPCFIKFKHLRPCE